MIGNIVDNNVCWLWHVGRERVDDLVAVDVVRGQGIWHGLRLVHVVPVVVLVGVVVALWHVDVVVV